MSIIAKFTAIAAIVFICLMIISMVNAQRFNALLIQYDKDKLLILGNELDKLTDEANKMNFFENPDREKLLEERYEKLLAYEKKFNMYEGFLRQSDGLFLPKQRKKFIELEKKYYAYQKENNFISKKVYATVNMNMKPLLTLARAIKKEKPIFDKVNKNDFSTLPEMRAEMKKIAQDMKEASALAKSVENKEISSEDVEYYQKHYEFYQAWADYLEAYNTPAVAKQDEAARRTVILAKWQDEHPLDNLYKKSYNFYVKPYDEKLQENIKAFEVIYAEQRKYIKPVPFFFALF